MRRPPADEPGWYEDPGSDGSKRYWDGDAWAAMAARPGTETSAGRVPPRHRRRHVGLAIGGAALLVVALGLAAINLRREVQPSVLPPTVLATGNLSTCALVQREVVCWGPAGGDEGQPTSVVEGASAVAGGGERFCAVLLDASPACWSASGVTIRPVALTEVVQLAVARDHACAVRDDDSVWCWGSNLNGELGSSEDIDERSGPVRVDLEPAAEVAVAPGRSCVRLRSGRISCWGSPYPGATADSNDGEPTSPTEIDGVRDATALAVASRHGCAVVDGGQVMCWGDNSRGQLGTGSPGNSSAERVPVIEVVDAASVAVSDYSSCALIRGGALTCWGDASFGQLGDGVQTDPRRQPVVVRSDLDAVDVSMGQFHTCAVFESEDQQTVRCWGANGSGQLGDGGTVGSLEPVEIDLE